MTHALAVPVSWAACGRAAFQQQVRQALTSLPGRGPGSLLSQTHGMTAHSPVLQMGSLGCGCYLSCPDVFSQAGQHDLGPETLLPPPSLETCSALPIWEPVPGGHPG